MIHKKMIVGPFQCNCHILICPKTHEAVVIDPGDEPQQIIQELGSLEIPIRVKWILHTHAHLDHIGGTRGVSEWGGVSARIALHEADHFIYQMLQKQGEMFGLQYEPPLPVQHFLEHEEQIQAGELKLSVIHTPGHSPGSVGFRLHEDASLGVTETLFSGDTLFQGSVGRTDLWGADGALMFRMIKERLFVLDGDTHVCPGHGEDTRIGEEKRSNPFFR